MPNVLEKSNANESKEKINNNNSNQFFGEGNNLDFLKKMTRKRGFNIENMIGMVLFKSAMLTHLKRKV